MNEDFNSNMNHNSSDDHLHHEEDYQFLSEIHKRRRITGRQVLAIVLGVCALGILFGVIAGAVFSAVTAGYSERHPSPVHMGADADSEDWSTAESTESGTVSVSANSSENAAASLADTGGTQTEEDSLSDYEALNARMKEIGDTARKSVVHVMGIRNTEDWLHNTDTSTVTKNGLIVADTGDRLMILTDNDGLDNVEKIAVEMADDFIVTASFVKRDPITNLAVIAVSKDALDDSAKGSFTVADLGNSYTVRSGDSIIAIGSPLGYSGSVVYGEVTSVDNTVSVTDGEYNLITTNIEGAASGNGFLINTDGRIVGMIFQKYATQNSSVIVGVPISLLKHLTEVLCNNGAISYAGIHGQNVSEAVSKNSGIPTGVYITQIDANSPALAAGLAVGDVITQMDGREIASMRFIHNKIASLSPGDTIPVTVRRQGANGYVKFKFELTIGECK